MELKSIAQQYYNNDAAIIKCFPKNDGGTGQAQLPWCCEQFSWGFIGDNWELWKGVSGGLIKDIAWVSSNWLQGHQKLWYSGIDPLLIYN